MADHDGQQLSPREMVRAHAYPVLAAISTLALVVIAAALVPIAKRAQALNQCSATLETQGRTVSLALAPADESAVGASLI